MFCCGVRLSKQQSKGVSGEISGYIRFEGANCTWGREGVLKNGVK